MHSYIANTLPTIGEPHQNKQLSAIKWFLAAEMMLLLSTGALGACKTAGKMLEKRDCPSIYLASLRKKVYTYADEMPKYPGGNVAIASFLSANYRVPANTSFQGSFKIECVIDTSGAVIETGILNKKDAELSMGEKDMVRLVKTMPTWKAGKCNGEKVIVRTQFSVML